MATNIYGSSFDDIIRQNGYADVNIYAYGGNDRIYLDLGGIYGGFNYVSAGSGNDRVYNSFEGGNFIDLGTGNDIYFSNGFSTATDYVDQVNAGDGNDTIQVSTYQSIYNGQNGNDTFFSVGWNNYFHGGAGSDTISFETQDSNADLSGYGIWIDLQQGFATANGYDEETLISIENAIGTGYADTIYGSNLANRLWGDAGNDDIRGYGGNDQLFGGSGADDLYGGSGRDILRGGSGRDYLVGGSGADSFQFTALSDSRVGSQRDVIADFRHSEGDWIDLRSIDADSHASGNQAFDFIGSAAFSGVEGELRFQNGLLSGDVNGDGRADFQIAVNGVTSMFDSDFLL